MLRGQGGEGGVGRLGWGGGGNLALGKEWGWGPEATWVGGADGEGAEGGDVVKLENYSLPGQTKGSHSLGLGAATPPHSHPALALADTAQPR